MVIVQGQEYALGVYLGGGVEGDGVESRAVVQDLVAGAVDAASGGEMEDGERKMENGNWKLEVGNWRTEGRQMSGAFDPRGRSVPPSENGWSVETPPFSPIRLPPSTTGYPHPPC